MTVHLNLKYYTRGFTLIEIMLVLVLMAVLTAMVAPNFFAATQTDVASEARWMQKVLRLASEDAQLDGRPVRCSLYPDHMLFETPNMKGRWQAMQDPLLQQNIPMPPVQILRVRLDGDSNSPDFFAQTDILTHEKPPLARIVFRGDGSVTPAHITLGIPEQSQDIREIQLRSGPGGIRVVQQP